MRKEKPTIEEFAAQVADKQDNPSIHELSKSFPEKTYKELESYRDADRHAEANRIPLTEDQKKLIEHLEAARGVCVTGELRKDREYEKEHKLRQEAQDALANALEVNESHHKLNGKLQVRVTELEEENKKLHDHINKQITEARKAGL